MGTELFHEDKLTDGTDRQTDRQTDRHEEAKSRSSQFLNASETLCSLSERLSLMSMSLVRPLTTVLVYD